MAGEGRIKVKRLWDAANAALDVIDAEIAQGLPEPEWAAQLREVIALIDEPSLEQDDCSLISIRIISKYIHHKGETHENISLDICQY